jgi:predicted permease
MRFYRALLHLYPASFRAEYGEEMCALYATDVENASFFGAILLAIGAFFDVLSNAAAVHWDILRQDLRYSARTLARTPGFTVTAIVVTALGVGANTAAFSLADRVFLRPLPFPDSDRLVRIWEKLPGYDRMELSPANYRDWKRMSTAFDSMGAFHSASGNLIGQGDPRRIEGSSITADLFPTLGVAPALGRSVGAADDQAGAPGTLLLSFRLWQEAFAGDPSVVGRRVTFDDTPYTVIGVMPREFCFPDCEAQFWTAMRFQDREFADRTDNYVEVVGRLRPRTTLAQARAAMTLVAGQLERQFPRENEHTGATVNRMRDEVSSQSRLLVGALCGAAACVLLIACANLANLLLARALIRRRELAVRTAIGAGRERLVRQLITESFLLGAVGGGAGVALATVAAPLLARLAPSSLPIPDASATDLRVLAFAALLTLVTCLLFGVVPALRACREGNVAGLREGSRTGGGRKERLRSALVIAEVMASVVLLVSAGLLVRALARVRAVDPGFRAEGVLTLRTALPWPKYGLAARREAFYERVLSDIRALPGVSGASYTSFLPMKWGGGIFPVAVGGEALTRADVHTASLRFVTPGYFATMAMPLHLGRDVRESDSADTTLVAVVSESFVRRYWPHENPLGRHFQFASGDRTVVGVVGDVRVRGLERESEPQVYAPYRQIPDVFEFYAPKDLAIRSAAPAASLVPAIRRIIRAADPEQPVSDVGPLSAIAERGTAGRDIQLRVLGAFAAIALLLAGIGIHGVLSFAVSTRVQEIGVRVALGARPGDILGMVLRQAALLALAGIVPGILLAWAAGRTMAALLAGIPPGDPVTLAGASAVAAGMTLAGALAPAVRAIRIDPVIAIRA